MVWTMWFNLLIALALGAPPSTSPSASPGPSSAALVQEAVAAVDPYDALLVEFQQAFRVWRKEMRGQRDPARRRELIASHPARVFEARFEKLGDEGDTRGLVWLLQNATHLSAKDEARTYREAVCKELIREHTDAAVFGKRGVDLILNEQDALGVASVEALLRELARKTAVPETHVAALRRLGAYLAAAKDEAAKARGHAVFEELIAEAEEANDADLARELRAELIRRRDLRVGMLAPDFEAKTVDGETFRLSDYRGKVVLIDFWGFWCASCRRELPHLKDVRDRFAGEPFVIVGVTTDEDKAEFRKLAAELDVDWVNAWDGGTSGPLSTAWGIAYFPTSYLIDAEGRIRKTNLRMQYLGLAVKQLLAELDG